MLISQERPAYKILSEKGFFGPDDHLYVFGEQIYFDGEPNEDMEPLNGLAREAMEEHLTKLDELGRVAAEKAGRAYAGRARSLEAALAQATEDARRVQSISNPTGVPLMKSSKKEKNTGVEKIGAEVVPETKGVKGKLSIKQSAA